MPAQPFEADLYGWAAERVQHIALKGLRPGTVLVQAALREVTVDDDDRIHRLVWQDTLTMRRVLRATGKNLVGGFVP